MDKQTKREVLRELRDGLTRAWGSAVDAKQWATYLGDDELAERLRALAASFRTESRALDEKYGAPESPNTVHTAMAVITK